MSNQDALRICVMGHSGVGKSPLTRLFNVDGWEPFRVRVPRNAEDAKVCKTPDEYERLEASHRSLQPLYESPSGNPNRLRVYEGWSFFEVREAKQCLEHTAAAKNKSVPLRVEIFAPVLLEMLKNADSLDRAFALDTENLLLLLLNPTSRSFRDMQEPSEELRLATLFATTERDRVIGKSADLADSLRRVEHLNDELAAWRELCRLFPKNAVECCRWPHFEFRYTSPVQEPQYAQTELGKARQSVLDAVKRQSPDLINRLAEIMHP
jgi:hypothetical protein